jgi:hypothetical protein
MLWVTNDGQALTPHCVTLAPDGEQGNSSVIEVGQVALTKLYEGLVGSPLQSVIEVVARSRGERSRHARVRGVSQDVHMDLTTSMPVLTVQAATVHGSPRVAKVVQHIPEQGWEAKMVQPIATEPSIGSEGVVGVSSIYRKQRRNGSTFHPSNRDDHKTQYNPQR